MKNFSETLIQTDFQAQPAVYKNQHLQYMQDLIIMIVNQVNRIKNERQI
jgi:hypothetical protein